MNSKKLKLTIIFTILFSLQTLAAQMTVDPAHSFYNDAQNWEIKGYTGKLPPLRPYAFANIKEILNSVIENGDEKAKTKAQEYFQELTGKPWHLAATGEIDYKKETDSSDKMVGLHPVVFGDAGLFNDFLSLGYKLGWDVRTDMDDTGSKAEYALPTYDAIQDPAKVGPLRVFLDGDTSIGIGKTNLFFQAGINRNGYGDFIGKEIALNETSYHKGNFAITYMNDYINYTQSMSVISATSATNREDFYPDKYLAFHALELTLVPNLKIVYYENVVFGNRFDPSYLIPCIYMVTQGINGCGDNLQMGLAFSYNIANKVQLKLDMMADDIDFNQAVKFNLDSKNYIAANAGIKYLPSKSWWDYIEFNYSLITPYTYSHWEFNGNYDRTISPNTINYQNYSNSGVPMGSPYDPNSDVFSLSTSFTPTSKLTIKTSANFVRHGNELESITDKEALYFILQEKGKFATDGSLYTHADVTNVTYKNGKYIWDDTGWVYTARNKLNFLTQDHIMYLIQPSVELSYKLPKLFGRFDASISFKYTYEYINNYGVQYNMYEGGQFTPDATGKYTFDGNTYELKDILDNDNLINQIVDSYKQQWIDNLITKQNHIFELYVTVML